MVKCEKPCPFGNLLRLWISESRSLEEAHTNSTPTHLQTCTLYTHLHGLDRVDFSCVIVVLPVFD